MDSENIENKTLILALEVSQYYTVTMELILKI